MKEYDLGTLGVVDEKTFLNMMPKVGDCFKINNANIWKCTKSDKTGLLFSKIVVQYLPDLGYYTISLSENQIYPSMDFLHEKHNGKIIQVNNEIYDNICKLCLNTVKTCYNILNG